MMTEEQLIALRSWVRQEINATIYNAGIKVKLSHKLPDDPTASEFADEAFERFCKTIFSNQHSTDTYIAVSGCHLCGKAKNHCICLHRPIRRKKQNETT